MLAQRQGADYVAFGRFFTSKTKPQASAVGVDTLRQARKVIELPIVAIGGVTAENGAPLLKAGADMLAVADGVFGQQNIKRAAAALSALFQ